MTDRTDIYNAFAARSNGGEFPCSWSREDYPTDFDRIVSELDAMDAEGLIRCLLRFRDVAITAQLSRSGIEEFKATDSAGSAQ